MCILRVSQCKSIGVSSPPPLIPLPLEYTKMPTGTIDATIDGPQIQEMEVEPSERLVRRLSVRSGPQCRRLADAPEPSGFEFREGNNMRMPKYAQR